MDKISFASDNYAGVSKVVMDYLSEINEGHVTSYGDDVITEKAVSLFKEEFGEDIDVFFVYNGTAANTLALGQITKSYNSIICADLAHIMIHEVTAPQTWTGCKFIPLESKNGKINADQIKEIFEDETYWGRHTALPKAVSISQTTEVGTIYTQEEIKKIAEVCHENGMYLHVDGARIANACTVMNLTFKELTANCGVDVLTFGGTKNGLMFGEALVFFNKKLAEGFEYVQKQGMQLNSKMRFLSGQYIPYFEKKLWYSNAMNANNLALLMAMDLKEIYPDCLVYPPQSNQLFVKLPPKLIELLLKDFHFYDFKPKENIIRLVTAFDSKKSEVEAFIGRVKELKR